MKCPVCGRDPGLNPFSICQFCRNALQQEEVESADSADMRLGPRLQLFSRSAVAGPIPPPFVADQDPRGDGDHPKDLRIPYRLS